MSKQFKGKTCVYCARQGASTVGEHVFNKKLFPIGERHNLPKVPACDACNTEKSQLEVYVNVVLPLASNLDNGGEVIDTDVARRLAKNRSLHKELSEGLETIWHLENGNATKTIGLPFDHKKMDRYIQFLVRGLTHFHWDVVVPQENWIGSKMFIGKTEEHLFRLLGGQGGKKVAHTIGDGVIHYAGNQLADQPASGIWVFSFFGHGRFGDTSSGITSSRFWAVCSRKNFDAMSASLDE